MFKYVLIISCYNDFDTVIKIALGCRGNIKLFAETFSICDMKSVSLLLLQYCVDVVTHYFLTLTSTTSTRPRLTTKTIFRAHKFTSLGFRRLFRLSQQIFEFLFEFIGDFERIGLFALVNICVTALK